MKPSNILLTALLVITFCFCFGSNLILKSEFEKRDLKDEYSGFKQEKLQPFKYLKLKGMAIGNVGIHQGKDFLLNTKLDTSNVKWSYRGDTLQIQFANGFAVNNTNATSTTAMHGASFNVYVLAPSFENIEIDGIPLEISEVKVPSLQLVSRSAPVWIRNAKIDKLTANILQGNLSIQKDVQLKELQIKARKESSFLAMQVIPNFTLDADSTTMIHVPAPMFQKGLQ